jgi:hypothetical protein
MRGKGAATGQAVQLEVAWHACHKSVDTLGYGLWIAALE